MTRIMWKTRTGKWYLENPRRTTALSPSSLPWPVRTDANWERPGSMVGSPGRKLFIETVNTYQSAVLKARALEKRGRTVLWLQAPTSTGFYPAFWKVAFVEKA